MKYFYLLCMLVVFASCESTPEVTSCEIIYTETPDYGTDYYGNIVFKGKKKTPKGWLHWDENKECPHQNGYKFRVLKQTSTGILKSDVCDYCNYSWSLHD